MPNAALQLLKGALSLGANTNKVNPENPEMEEGVISDKIPELKSSTTDEELITMSSGWRKKWNNELEKTGKDRKSLKKKREDNENYWLGNQYNSVQNALEERPLVDNLIFEALETFLPVATKQNPEPMVSADDTEEGLQLAKDVQKLLNKVYDTQKIKLKVKQAVRHWSLYYVGILKVGWSLVNDDVVVTVVNPKNVILDPDGIVEGGEYNGKYLGEWKKDTAGDLKRRFPSKKSFVDAMVGKDGDGTEISYIEWWTADTLFWELKGEVLDKVKNPLFNYEKEETVPREILDTEDESFDLFDTIKVPGINHFKTPKIPYIFLNVFSLGEHPYDDTGLIEQNLPLQDLINKRQKQIDKNVDGMNGGWAISLQEAGLTQEQAGQAVKAIMRGGAITIPSGSVDKAVKRMTGTGLPNDVFNQLVDARNELRGVFGVTGISPQGISNENTVRGKILTRGADVDRIGGTITEHIEQFVDYLYNYILQVMYVFYDSEHTAAVLGDKGAEEFISLSRAELQRKQLTVSVKEGSLLPKDPLTKRNEAIDLWQAQAIDPLTLYQRLDDPNPRDAVERLITWQTNPMGLIDESAQGQVPQVGMEQPQQIPQQQQTVSPETEILNQVPVT